MADRENVKIVISAALIVIVASMGIYAFIYRDKISEMLPNWQRRGKSSERMILDGDKDGLDSSASQSLSTAEEDRDLPSYKVDAEAKEYPEIPNLPKKEDSNQSANSASQMEKDVKSSNTASKLPESASSSLASIQENPIPPEVSDKNSTVYKTSSMDEYKPKVNTSTGMDTKSSKPSSISSTKQKNNSSGFAKEKAKSSIKTKTSPQTKTVSKAQSIAKPSYKTSKPKTNTSANLSQKSSSSVAKTSSTEERIKKLESKLNVHMQDTNSRLESIERRVEKLERKLLETQ